jgi:hypothetical protein
LLLGSIVAMLLMDKLGRKVLLSGSFLAMVNADRTWRKYLTEQYYFVY